VRIPVRRLRRLSVATPFAFALALASAPATADLTKDQCIDADTQAQTLRRGGKLTATREQLLKCGDPSCPALVRDDCSRRLDELERAQPTILFEAKDGAGRDVVGVKVSMDGQPLAESLGGTALKVDPGPRSFTFTAPGLSPLTQTFVIREGEKERRERVVLGAPVESAPAPGVAVLPSTPPESPPSGMARGKVYGLILGGVGVAGVAVGSVFGLMTASAGNQQKTDCASASSCAHYGQAASDHTTAQNDGTISTVAFIAGGALLAGGAVLFFVSGSSPSEPSATSRLVVAPSVGPGAGGLLLRGEF
jgi:hypothetical protein